MVKAENHTASYDLLATEYLIGQQVTLRTRANDAEFDKNCLKDICFRHEHHLEETR